jgi:hypothetical protein
MAQAPAGAVGAEAALYLEMRTVWMQHMNWTYSTIVAFASDFPGLQPTLDRLLLNQADIGNAIVPYYGDGAGAQLTELLKAHINDAVPVLGAAKAGDNAALQQAVDVWYANAQAIADFLAGANPNWPQADMREMMAAHITQTIAYATAILTGDYAGAVSTYGEAEDHMIAMGDMLSAGVVAQFPDRFV